MNADLFTKILEDHKELSSLPQTLTEVLRVLRDDNSSAGELAEVISRDPSLTAKMLRIVNSPFYGAGREITTLSQAVVTIGTRAVSALALSTSIYDISGKWKCGIDRIRFWRHSLEVAVASRALAEAINYPRSEEAFIAGILHDLGLLVLEKSFPDKFKKLWKQAESGEHLFELEEETWGTNHARVGQFLLEQWHVPSVICEAVGQHHNNFPPDTDDADFLLPQIVLLANRIAKFSTANSNYETVSKVEQKEIVRKNLEIPNERLKKIEENLFKMVVDEANFLEIEIGSTQEILIEANQLLYRKYLLVENLLEENSNMHKEITQSKIEKASLEAVQTITATLSHYINNAVATILGRAQLVEVGIQKNELVDNNNKLAQSMNIIIQGVNTIQLVLQELKNINKFEKTVYYDETYILDIEKKIRSELDKLNIRNKESVSA